MEICKDCKRVFLVTFSSLPDIKVHSRYYLLSNVYVPQTLTNNMMKWFNILVGY